MFGLHKSIKLKRDILEVLDNATDYLSIKEIQELLEYPSFHSVKQACTELKELFQELFHPDEAQILIKVSGGIKIERHGNKTQRITEYLVTEDLIYTFLRTILLERTIDTDTFLEKHFISRSALYARIRRINQSLNPYELHITLSNQIRLKGEEYRIRSFSYIFLFITHRMIDQLPHITHKNTYLSMTKKIFGYLEIPLSENVLQSLAIFTFITQNGASKNTIHPHEKVLRYVRQFEYPEKPQFLTDWHTSDWEFYLYFLYLSNRLDFQYKDKLVLHNYYFFEHAAKDWVTCFETYFFHTTEQEKKKIYTAVNQQLLSIQTFPFNKEFFDNVKMISEDQTRLQFPELMERFELFWSQLTQIQPLFASSFYTRQVSLLTVIQLMNFDFLKPSIKVYIYSDIGQLHQDYLTSRLTQMLTNYKFEFVSTPPEAALIISTVEYLEPVAITQQLLVIHSTLSPTDLIIIERTLQNIVETKNRVNGSKN
uniref:helix-turn-helix domain-containing protein n=1 Tax=Candidatus Enterococcus willemsii TaxID=1857215 RepID=UPI00403F8F5F